ncbi:uncharacterized protein LOC119669217 [Teleopsis dalmanni]|uniref:uncharacterized protein LOC119669217 n=1 Tax=Teleopsis dalmanni TaxID=139649 RepID=UPI0018CD523F|nr:uncharacterized protein LOC119669217 [Teleopsis dalmanni]
MAASHKKKKHSLEFCPWQSKLRDVNQRFGYLLEKGKFGDCVVIAGRHKERFLCHKLILAIVSPKFETIFYEDGLSEVEYEDVNADVFRYALQHIYMQDEVKTPFPYALAGKLFYMAMKFKMEFLRVTLIRILSNAPWPVEHVLTIYNSVKVYSESLMLSLSIDHIQNYKLDFLFHSTVYKQEAVVFKCVIQALQRRVAEIHIFQAIERYCLENNLFEEELEIEEGPEGIADPDVNVVVKPEEISPSTSFILNISGPELCGSNTFQNRKALVKDLCDLINFRGMTPTEFAAGPATSKLLTPEESFSILISLCKEHNCKDINTIFNFSGASMT